VNLNTLSGVYENARTVSRTLGDGTRLEEAVKRVLGNPDQRRDLAEALSRLDQHLHVMGFEEVLTKRV
jgi:hypothetical protein